MKRRIARSSLRVGTDARPGYSVGLATLQRGDTLDELIDRADAAVYRASAPEATLTPPWPRPPTEHEILDVNRRYHDVAAHDYDAKWGIDYGEVGAAQVLGKLTQAARRAAPGRTRARSRSARAPATSRSTC